MKVGILGGGQLGRMLALAGCPLGLEFRVFDPSPAACGAQVAEHVCASFEDKNALERFSDGLDAVTYEWENVPVEFAREVESRVPIFAPASKELEIVQDRLSQKTFISGLGIAVAPFARVLTLADLDAALREIGFPAVLKTCRSGYDGKGQVVIRSLADAEAAWAKIGGVPLVLEAFIAFERELSIISVHGHGGQRAFYQLAENRHRDGILRVSVAPAPDLKPGLQELAEEIATSVAKGLDHVGVLAIEFFEHQGRLIINEVATRVHNSGHWTMDGAQVSQFENHLRAVVGLPLGDTRTLAPTVMVNLIGSVPSSVDLLRIAGAKLHLYGKSPASGRKLGHVNAPLEMLEELKALIP